MQETLKTITKNMKQEEKDHLLNDKNLSAEEQAEVKLLFNRLDALGIEYQTLSTSLREIMDSKAIEIYAEHCATSSDGKVVESFKKEAKAQLEEVLDNRIAFDIFIPEKNWVFNITPGKRDILSSSQKIDSINLSTSFESIDAISLFASPKTIMEFVLKRYYKYPHDLHDKLLLWSDLLKEIYRGHYSSDNVKGAVDFYAELAPKRVTELKEVRFRKFLADNHIWEEKYAECGKEYILQNQEPAHLYQKALKRAPYVAADYVKSMNPQFDFDDILDQITE
jgi:hypothetical protein